MKRSEVCFPVLALDSSSPRLSLALRASPRARVFHTSVMGFSGHARRLVPLAEKLLSKARVSWREVRTCAVGTGPGSFTGLRVGLAAVKGFALAGPMRVVGLPSDVLTGFKAAGRLAQQGRRGLLGVAMNARREHAYTALFHVRPNAVLASRSSALLALANLPEFLARLDWCTGDLRDELTRRSISIPSNVTWLDPSLWYPDARTFFDVLDKTTWVRAFTLRTLKPLYLHPPLS